MLWSSCPARIHKIIPNRRNVFGFMEKHRNMTTRGHLYHRIFFLWRLCSHDSIPFIQFKHRPFNVQSIVVFSKNVGSYFPSNIEFLSFITLNESTLNSSSDISPKKVACENVWHWYISTFSQSRISIKYVGAIWKTTFLRCPADSIY